MCTAIYCKGIRPIFGRTLDFERSFGESALVTPRRCNLSFKYLEQQSEHFAIVGIGTVKNGMPLYFDALNECGLAAAALNFPKSAVYLLPTADKLNLASFELIPWILSNACSVTEAEALLSRINITNDSVSAELPATPMHWMFADKERAIVAEPSSQGLMIYNNELSVLTNEPPFPCHLQNVIECMGASPYYPSNKIAPSLELSHISTGHGSSVLPGGHSSSARFVRAVFANEHCEAIDDETGSVNRFFHITECVSVPLGCIKNENGKSVMTLYTSCADILSSTYYFSTYSSRRIKALELNKISLDSRYLLSFDMQTDEDISYILKSNL